MTMVFKKFEKLFISKRPWSFIQEVTVLTFETHCNVRKKMILLKVEGFQTFLTCSKIITSFKSTKIYCTNIRYLGQHVRIVDHGNSM